MASFIKIYGFYNKKSLFISIDLKKIVLLLLVSSKLIYRIVIILKFVAQIPTFNLYMQWRRSEHVVLFQLEFHGFWHQRCICNIVFESLYFWKVTIVHFEVHFSCIFCQIITLMTSQTYITILALTVAEIEAILCSQYLD